MSGLHASVERLRGLFGELRRRRVFQVAAAYAAIFFVLIQAADLVYPALGLPGWAYTATVLAGLAGFPVAIALGWVYDLTAEGVRRTDPLPAGPAEPSAAAVLRQDPAWAASVAILPFATRPPDPTATTSATASRRTSSRGRPRSPGSRSSR